MRHDTENPDEVRPRRSSDTSLLLGKVKHVLDCFLPDNYPQTLTEIHRRTGMPTSTTLRILRSLVEQGFLVQREGQYQLGLSMIKWAAAVTAGAPFGRWVQPILDGLRDMTGETVTLTVNEDLQRVCVAVAPSRQSVIHVVHVGTSVPLQSGASGKVLLAWDPVAIREVLRRGLSKFTDNTCVDEKRFVAQLRRVREAGCAVTESEVTAGAASVSAPIFDVSGRVAAALTIGGPSQRMTRKVLLALAATVCKTAAEISLELGYDPRPLGSSGDGLSMSSRQVRKGLQ